MLYKVDHIDVGSLPRNPTYDLLSHYVLQSFSADWGLLVGVDDLWRTHV